MTGMLVKGNHDMGDKGNEHDGGRNDAIWCRQNTQNTKGIKSGGITYDKANNDSFGLIGNAIQLWQTNYLKSCEATSGRKTLYHKEKLIYTDIIGVDVVLPMAHKLKPQLHKIYDC